MIAKGSELLIIGFDDNKPLGKNPLTGNKKLRDKLYSPKIIVEKQKETKQSKEGIIDQVSQANEST